ncbi:N-acetylmuramoyl-L-alanine amidase [Rudaea cellulosilytica]|uniref:N-acetylmuramoyl-L-alanine amidase n=1 Tax=Rudaea cellulosilytica TaxID=540746 RepID=UPI0003AA3CD8|nr:N-acetylmuramoyl-L-alanine amidase [Rudaea cellulosilytica]
MWGIPCQSLRRLTVGGLLLVLTPFSSAADLKTAKIAVEAERTRVFLDLAGPVDYKLFEIANPDRIVLDLRDSAAAESFAAPGGKGLLKSLRTGAQNKTDLRVVLDLAADVRPKSFLMPPDGGQGYRLVVDLYPKGKGKAEVVKSARVAPAKARDVVVMIDPGHGGNDPGAKGNAGTQEKNITMMVSRELKRQIDKTPGMRAVLTRDGDYYVGLEDRYHKAREMKADLFVSIHADAFTSSDARGSSVWMLSPRGATSEAARFLADRENNSDLVGGVKLDRKDNTLAAVLLDLSQSSTIEASGAVAQQVLRAIGKLGPTHRGYVEKANFVVLRSPDVPSILVETAFITNPEEERRLNNPEQRELLATAILNGMRTYLQSTPPPGTQFAVAADKNKPERLASRKVEDSDDSSAEGIALARVPRS